MVRNNYNAHAGRGGAYGRGAAPRSGAKRNFSNCSNQSRAPSGAINNQELQLQQQTGQPAPKRRALVCDIPSLPA
ncbi:hypothetical protein FSARC_5413 [Fusarium sarcochroum]|uniref:Uncharacterized protein n=1 Tax=Fusarium sarcochroum TaxID=1208366 RepID=A0A8H4TZN4_9HYPO|nr:hypothetical protein FSARC_5413 [Fusarium sarcochroum]